MSKKESSRIRSQKWRSENKEKHREYSKKYYAEHREQVLERVKENYKINPPTTRKKASKEQKMIWNQNRRSNKNGKFSKEQWISLCIKYGNKCLCCGEEKSLTPDHVIPISKGGMNIIENIQPLCIECNQRKFTKIIDYR